MAKTTPAGSVVDNIIASQPLNLPLLATTETCSGGTYIVTGANTGLGLETAKHLVALRAAKVILAVRNVDAGEKAKAEIEAATAINNVAEVWELDLASYASVKAFAKKATAELERIDALIENAGVAHAQKIMAEGHLLPVTVNVLSTFLLAVLLLPKMSEDARSFGILPHIVIVTSGSGFGGEAEWKRIQDDPLVKIEHGEPPMLGVYPLSKLMEIAVVRHLAPLISVDRTGVVMNLVSPGLCNTDLSRNATPEFRQKLAQMHAKFGRTAEDGSRTLLFGAVAGRESHGCYTESCRISKEKLPSWMTDEEAKEAQKRAWEVVARELELIEPGCVKTILEG